MLQLERLRDVHSNSATVSLPHSRRRRWARLAAIGLSGVVLGGVVAGTWLRLHQPKIHGSVLKFEIAPPPSHSFAASPSVSVPVIDFSVSPDGSRIAFVAEQDGLPVVCIREMREPVARPLTG